MSSHEYYYPQVVCETSKELLSSKSTFWKLTAHSPLQAFSYDAYYAAGMMYGQPQMVCHSCTSLSLLILLRVVLD